MPEIIEIIDADGEVVRPRQRELEKNDCTDIEELNYTRHPFSESVQPCSHSSYIVRMNKWHNHKLNKTLNRYENEQRRMVLSHKWNQQQFFISQVFDKYGKVRYSKPSSTLAPSPKKYKYGYSNDKDQKTFQPDVAKTKSIAVLRDGLFNSTTTVPHNILRHQSMVKKLYIQEKRDHSSQEVMTETLRTRLPSIIELSPADKEKYKWKTMNDRQQVLLKKANDRKQKKNVVDETRTTVFMGQSSSLQRGPGICDDNMLWQIVAHLPTKLMKTAYQSGYKLIEERQRKYIKRNVDRIEELRMLASRQQYPPYDILTKME